MVEDQVTCWYNPEMISLSLTHSIFLLLKYSKHGCKKMQERKKNLLCKGFMMKDLDLLDIKEFQGKTLDVTDFLFTYRKSPRDTFT